MRKLSIKTLSLVLSLLLMIPVLFALPFSAKAEAEATPGDLNGDSLVDQSDIELLEAVLAGTQEVNMTYDVSGNRMVGSEDLVVLKNLVDPTNNPALPDKLADGTTDDLLVGAAGTGVQGAVVRGDSTRAAGANGKTVKVMFAETQTQDWRQKKALKMDALWVSGEEFGFTLLDENGNAIGAETKVACKDVTVGWTAIEVPLNGAVSRDRAAVGGFMISAPNAEVYLDNLSLVDMEATDMSTVTREDMEKALVEVAWNYYLKKGKVQYDSVEFNTSGSAGSNSPLSKDYGSAWRTNPFSTLEDATSDSNIYSVCSDYCWSVYYEALGYPVLGNRVNAVTPGLFYNIQYPQDMAVLRWWDAGVDTGKLKTHNNGVTPVPTHTAADAIAFFQDWGTNFRPGDIIVMHGNGSHQHAMLYVGNGQILHCGGGKLDMETGKDDTEPNGAIHLTSINGTFFGYDQDGYFNLEDSASLGAIADENTYGAWLVVVRPLDVLTVDDGNEDLADDNLDLTYELNTGLIKYELNGQIGEQDITNNHSVKTSGYEGITAVTQTRLDYPGMDIDRTVSVKNYGTVAKDGELTYKITITNNSNNENYITSYGKDNYTGEAYTGLVVTETVPANVEFVSSGDGTAPDANGKITWTVNIAAGESVELTYTVRATGNVGDKIVNGGGYVGNISSNVLTTTIGGEKLANVDDDFVSAGVSGWNSEIYKISANPADGTDFAERVYNEMTGLALELPSMQELASNFFTQKKLYQPHGLHQSYNKSLTRHMYTLNAPSEMAEGYLTYRNMLVEGYYGGIWVYSNDYGDEPRIIDPNVRDLEIGDIMVCMNLTGSVSGGLKYEERTVRSWRVLVYLGDNTFASLDSNKQMLKAEASTAVSALTYDMFLVLRPSQAYEDLNTAIGPFNAEVAWDETTDKAYVYAPPASSQPLSAENQTRITALAATATDSDGNLIWTAGNLSFATQVYKEIGIDIRSDGLKGAAYSTLFTQNIFVSDKSTGYKYALSETRPLGYEELHTMVKYYGGSVFAAGSELTTLDDLTVGDVIILGNRDDGVSAYLCAVYQGKDTNGNGNFLVVTRQYPNGDSTLPQVNTYSQETVTDLDAWLGQSIYKDSEDTTTYQGYVVLRPSAAYEDINALRVRDITEGGLTDVEKTALQSLTIEDWLDGDRATQFDHFPGWAYRSAKVNIDDIVDGKTVTYAQLAIFKTVSGKLVPMVPEDANYDANYANMLVHGLYGGAQTKNPGRLISADELEVGDIFVAAKRNTDSSISGNYVYRVALYQGVNEDENAQFLITDVVSGGEGGTAWISTGSGNSDTAIIDTDYSEWLYYFVLRPEQVVYTDNDLWSICLEDITMIAGETKDLVLVTAPATYEPSSITWESSDKSVATVDATGKITAHRIGECTITATCGGFTTSCTVEVPMRSITTGILTAEEMDILKNYSTDTSALARVLAVNAYAAADIDISTLFSGLSFFNIQEKILDSNGDLLASTASGYDANFAKMLVPGYYGGGYNATKSDVPTGKTFVPGDFKVGDLFLAVCEASCEHGKKWTYITGLYIGEGKFLMMRHNSGCSERTCRTVTIDEYNVTADSAVWGDLESLNAYRFYFVLRPERLAARSITTGALTPEEIAAIKTLTKASVTTGNPGPVINSIYSAAGIDVSSNFGTLTFWNLMKKNFDGTSYALLDEATADANHRKMLVSDYYGGAKLGIGKTFVPEDFKIGDLFCAVYVCPTNSGKWVYTIGVYQGNGQFLMVENHAAGTCTDACKTANDGTDDSIVWGDEAAMLALQHYFVLRPERLAPVSLEKSEVTLYRNEEATLNIAVKPDTYNSLTWTSSNEEVATVDASGNVTGKSAGTAVITVNCDGYKASCTVTVDSNRLITSGALTAEEETAIKGLEKSDLTVADPASVAKEVYDAAGIDVSSLFNTTSFWTLMGYNFDTSVSGVYTLLDEASADANHRKMLVADYYGGGYIDVDRVFTPEDFKVGDLFCAAYKCSTSNGWVYATGIYQGNGKFLMIEKHAGSSCTDTCKTANDGTDDSIVWGDAEAMDSLRIYFVLRPERLAPDALQSISLNETELDLYRKSQETLTVTTDPETVVDAAKVTWRSDDEAVATVDANGQITGVSEGTAVITAYYEGYSASCTVTVDSNRLITSGALTSEEMAAISELTSLTVTTPGPVVKEAYAIAGIDVTDPFGKLGFTAVLEKVFDSSTGLPLKTPDATYGKMLLAGYYGGTLYTTNGGEKGKDFTPNDFKVGDVFIAFDIAKCGHSGTNTVTGIYIGNGKFILVSRNTGCTDGGCHTSCIDAYVSTESVGVPASVTSVWAGADTLNTDYKFYFVLRPERLASDAIQSISLNETELTLEKNATATLTVTKDPVDAAPNAAVTWVSSNESAVTVVDGKITAVGVGSATITAYCDGYSASCVVTVTARNITSGALTAEEMAAISALMQSDLNALDNWNPGPVAYNVYLAAGIDISAVLQKQGFNDVRKAVLANTETDHTKILLPGYYGGYSKSTGKTFVPADMKVGDIFCATYGSATCEHSKYQYLTGIYQGDGKFLVVHFANGCTDGCSIVYVDEYGKDLTNGKTSIWSDTAAEMETFQYYFVLRPERLASDALQSVTIPNSDTMLELNFSDANSLPAANAATLSYETVPAVAAAPASVTWSTSNPDVATVVDGKITAVGAGTCTITVNCDGYTATCDVTITRNIKARTTLTATEQAAIAGYDTDNGYVLWYTFGTNAYAAANITVDAFNTKLGFNDLWPEVLSTTEVTDYSKMLVPGYYGGYSKNTGKTFVPGDLEVGDILCTSYGKTADKCGSSSSAWRYVTALYKGNDTWLVVVRCCKTGECEQVYEDVYNSGGTTSVPEGYISLWSDADTLNSKFGYYFVLRPSQLAE